MQQNYVKALKWIITLLNQNNIPYVLCGGFAVFVYSSNRPINDIDLFVPNDYFNQVVELGKEYVSKPAKHYCEETEGWDLEYVQFIFENTKIEIGNDKNIKIFNSVQNKWVDLIINFSDIQNETKYNLDLVLMNKHDLMAYKQLLGRDVDIQDVNALKEL